MKCLGIYGGQSSYNLGSTNLFILFKVFYKMFIARFGLACTIACIAIFGQHHHRLYYLPFALLPSVTTADTRVSHSVRFHFTAKAATSYVGYLYTPRSVSIRLEKNKNRWRKKLRIRITRGYETNLLYST